MQHKEVDYIIVGQGLAGTLISYNLLKAGKKILVVDQEHKGSSSKIAAGLINPITGRRFVKSWMVEKLLPVAKEQYTALETLLDIPIFHSRNIIRALFNSREENDWLVRTGEPGYGQFMADEATMEDFLEVTEPAYSYGELLQSAQVDVPLLIEKFRAYLLEGESLLSEQFDFEQLIIKEEQLSYRGISAKKVIFCEGYQGQNNPYFSYLPFNPAKGEILIIRIPNANFKKLFKHRIFIAPLGNDHYWVGATNDWDFGDDQPTAEARSFLLERLQDVLKIPFSVVTHQAAIRPTVKDRRPFIGVHPNYSNLVIFNGLGTKGASLGPYWAAHLAEVLVKNSNLEDSVNIKRFAEIYANQHKSSS